MEFTFDKELILAQLQQIKSSILLIKDRVSVITKAEDMETIITDITY